MNIVEPEIRPDSAASPENIIEVRDLAVEFPTPSGRARVVDGVNLDLRRGQTLGVVGESGSGKTVTALSMLRLLGPTARMWGEANYQGRNLLVLKNAEMNKVRGREIAMIFQEPRRSLDPSFSIGDQISEVARRHLDLSRRDASERAVDMLARVGIRSPKQRAKDYPHQFSGGMCQRVMLAMALVASPKVLIADEPTTALDVTVQALVLDLIRELQEELELTVLFITHDLAVVAEISDHVAVMYAGQVVEMAPASELFTQPRHPYTAGLLAALPQNHSRNDRLGSIGGVVPPPHAWPSGCRFHPRCAYAVEACHDEVPDARAAGGHGRLSRCLRVDELELEGVR